MTSNNSVRTEDKGATIFLQVSEQFAKGVQGIRAGIVGKQGAKRHGDSDLTNAELGFIHEHGLGVPRRPFLKPAAKEAEKGLREASIHGYEIMMNMIKRGNKNVQAIVNAGLEPCKQHYENVMKQYIISGKVQPPTEDGGIPLYDTGELARSISAYIETKDGKTNKDA